MKNFRLLPLLVLTLSVAPLAFFLWFSASIYNRHLKSSVVNDPDSGLAQSVIGFNAAANSLSDRLLNNSLRFSESEGLRKVLAPLNAPITAIRTLCNEELKTSKFTLLILTDSKGNVLFDTLNIPRPTPSPTPSPSPATPTPASKKVKKIKIPKTKISPYASIKDWPGMDHALTGADAAGVLSYQDDLYQILAHPVIVHQKVQGVLLMGDALDKNFLKNLKRDTGSELAVYSDAQTFCTKGLPPPIDYKIKTGYSFNRLALHWNGQDYLAAGLPLVGMDQKPLGVLTLFQPVKQSLVIEGTPQKTVLRLGLLFLLLSLALALLALWQYMVPFNRLLEAVDQIKKGDLNVSLPLGRLDELGLMARSLRDMIESLREKDRVSLILGKVVSPQVAKNILEAKDLFALKGERREVTLLYADLRGFNILSENMAPQSLVESLNQYFSLINEIVFKHEGMLDKFIGDTAIAVWGAPFTHEDKELRAVKTALEIQEALKDFNISRIKKGQPPFTIGIGIHTGMVVSGNLGSEKHSDYTVIGEPLHIVQRLCSMASPGQTVVSEETYQKVRPQVKAAPLNPIAVKGSMESLKTYEITQIL